MKKIVFLLLTAGVYTMGMSQSRKFDYALQGVDGKLSLEKYRGKPLILDFFTAGCVACFNMMPKVNELQEKFKERVSMVMVGNDRKKLPGIYEKFSKRMSINLVAIFDSALFRKFNPPFVPRYAWIDEGGLIRGQSGPELFTEMNITRFITGDYSFLEQSVEKKSFNTARLLPMSTEPGFYYRSLITPPVDSLRSRLAPRLAVTQERPFFQLINVPVSSLVKYSVVGKSYWSDSDELYGEVWESVIWENDLSLDSILSVVLCYSIAFDGYRSPVYLRHIIKNDLLNHFGIEARLEERTMPYWSLQVDKDSIASFRSKGGKAEQKVTASSLRFVASQIKNLVGILEYRCKSELPFIDETGLTQSIDLSMDVVTGELDQMQIALAGKGIHLVKKERPIQVIVAGRANKNVAARGLLQH